MLAEIEKDQDTVAVNRITSGNNRTYRQNQQQNFRPRAPGFNSNFRPSFNLRSSYSGQSSFPCQPCLQAGKPDYVARSHSSAQCQSFIPRNKAPVAQNRTPAMRLIAAPVPDISDDSTDPSAQNENIFMNNYYWNNYPSGENFGDSSFAYGAPNVPFNNEYSDANFHYASQQD